MEGARATGKLPRVRSKRRRRLRSHRLLAGAILILLVLVSAGTAVGYIALKPRADKLQAAITADLQAGQRELEVGKNALKQASTKRDASLVTEAVAQFVAAKGKFLAASQLADNSRLLHDLELLPGAGSLAQSRHAAVDGIAEMGVALSDAGQDLSAFDSQFIKPTDAGQGGRNILTVVDEAQPTLVKVRSDLQRAQNGALQVDLAVVPADQKATFLRARDGIESGLAGLGELDRLVPVLHEVLGGNGTRTYLVEQVNPSELRAGGGFIGTYSLIRAENGMLSVIRSGDAYDLVNPRPQPGQAGFIPLPDPYREKAPNLSWSFVDSNIYPDFESNAKTAETFVKPRIGYGLDGVISIDYYTVSKMLDLTGPVTVDGFGTVTGRNFISQLFPGDITADAYHKRIVSSMAGQLIKRVAALQVDQWPAVITALSNLAAHRHLQVYFDNPSAEGEISRVGWSGSINLAGTQDYMMEIESNYYGNKANYFLKRHYTVVLTRSGGTLHHKVLVELINNEPLGEEARVTYIADTRLYVPASASATTDNLPAVLIPNPTAPAGTRTLDGWLVVPCCAGRSEAIFEYDTPWPLHELGPETIYWQKQPGIFNDMLEVVWNAGTSTRFTASGDLAQDLVISLSSNGLTLSSGVPAQAAIPNLNLGDAARPKESEDSFAWA
ncbi:DUF4012 domain-containing protein [bacterium]|nr:MAG: DUF4012 domain-containing protein [bacterium]